jgi:hypothetical protein
MPELIDTGNRIAQESNEMLLRTFVSAIGYDYIAHHEKHTAQIHPDFSEDTVKLWKEIESRLKAPTCLTFNIDKANEILNEEIDKQYGIIEQNEYATQSYHAGIKTGLTVARSIMRLCIMKEVNEDAGTD